MAINFNSTLFLFLRHGQTSGNEKNIYRSWSNAPMAQLNEEGQKEAREAARYMQKNKAQVKLIICDSLDRTLETAEIVAEEMGFPQIVVIRGLHPLNMGDWTLKPKSEFPADMLWQNRDKNARPPGGESVPEFDRRQMMTFKTIFKMADEQPPGSMLVVGHGSNVAFLHNTVFNTGDARVAYEGLVDAGGLINATKGGMVPLTKIRGSGKEPSGSESDGQGERFSAEEAEYMELAGAEKDADCRKVYVEDGVSSALGCCDKFFPEDDSVKNFRCGTCEYITEG